MKIAVGCDHAGIHLKPLLIDYLEKNGIGYTDFGTKTEESCNYAEYGGKLRFRHSDLRNGNRYEYRREQSARDPLRALHGRVFRARHENAQ